MDREHNGPVIVSSSAGGVDIEEVAEKTPHLILKVSHVSSHIVVRRHSYLGDDRYCSWIE